MSKADHAGESKKHKVNKPTHKSVRVAKAEQPVAHAGLGFAHKHYIFIAKGQARRSLGIELPRDVYEVISDATF